MNWGEGANRGTPKHGNTRTQSTFDGLQRCRTFASPYHSTLQTGASPDSCRKWWENGRLPKCWAEFPKLQLLDRDACNTTLRERLESLTFENLRAIASQLTSSLNSGIPRGSCGLNRIARLLGTEDSEGL